MHYRGYLNRDLKSLDSWKESQFSPRRRRGSSLLARTSLLILLIGGAVAAFSMGGGLNIERLVWSGQSDNHRQAATIAVGSELALPIAGPAAAPKTLSDASQTENMRTDPAPSGNGSTTVALLPTTTAATGNAQPHSLSLKLPSTPPQQQTQLKTTAGTLPLQQTAAEETEDQTVAVTVDEEAGLLGSALEMISSVFERDESGSTDGDATAAAPPTKSESPSATTRTAAAGSRGEQNEIAATSQPVDDAIATEAVAQPDQLQAAAADSVDSWNEITIRRGDNLARIFDRNKASRGDLQRIIDLGGEAGKLTSIHPGQQLRLQLNSDGRVDQLEYPVDELRTLHVKRDGDRFTARVSTLNTEIRERVISARIKNSLYLSARDAGLSEGMIMELASIFGWDIDFALDIRTGDYFTVMFEELHADSGKIKDGSILAAEFVNQDKSFRAVRYTDPNGATSYYNPEGRSMRKAFLRSPVDFRRISSRFQRERWHPVLGKKRPHRGVDYAAATGTPIRASGDGRITFVGYKGGYGKTVVIQHGTSYSTLYGHLNGYRKGIRSGKYVKQGQTIGYVGSTGLATGPHLHYEFRVNGVHRNPLTVKLPAAEPIPSRYREDFLRKSKPLLATIEQHASTLLARN